MNVTTHQEKEKNEKTVKRKAEVKRRQANFKEAASYPSAVVKGAARRKNGLCEGSAQGNWDPRKGQQSVMGFKILKTDSLLYQTQ